MSVELSLGAVQGIPKTLQVKISGATGAMVQIPVGFMPGRVTVVLDGTTDHLVEYMTAMGDDYFRVSSTGFGIRTGPLINETAEGFEIDTSLEGAGTYYICAWR